MDITFEKQDKVWIATIEVVSDFALHIEKEKDGLLNIYQSSVINKTPDKNPQLSMSSYDTVLDKQVIGVVYPIYLTIKSETVNAPVAIITYPKSVQEAIDEAIVSVLNNPV